MQEIKPFVSANWLGLRSVKSISKQPMGCDAQLAAPEGMSGEVYGGHCPEWDVQIPTENYKSLHIAVMICARLVTTQIHIQTDSILTSYTISSAS